ncbi:type II toxin-antitoxin system VapC family toxin [Myxococcota bacterium]|nr:type II toxin-antitoxin system VapC family toxin [Myxococcota bacterium]
MGNRKGEERHSLPFPPRLLAHPLAPRSAWLIAEPALTAARPATAWPRLGGDVYGRDPGADPGRSLTVLVDSNVLLDVMTEDPEWSAWSGEALAECAERSALAINPLVYAEVSIRFERIEELEDALPEEDFMRLPLPWEAAFLAGKCFVRYRRRRGPRRSPLPDFDIGAHAAVVGLVLLTRDATRDRTYFPGVDIIRP